MARRARIRVSDFERRAGTRYTIDTVRKLERRYPDARFVWLMGADTVAEFHQWKALAQARGITPDCGDLPPRL